MMFIIIMATNIFFLLVLQEITKATTHKTVYTRCRHYARKKIPSRGKLNQEILPFNSIL